jgi:hypothetical protein
MIAITSRLRVGKLRPTYHIMVIVNDLQRIRLWKNVDLSLEPKRFEILIFAASVTPISFRFLSGVSFILLFDPKSSRGTFGVKCWKWGVSRHFNIGLQILSDLQKNLIFATTYKFQRAFLHWIKIVYCFQKEF